jgi:hypothetical protein
MATHNDTHNRKLLHLIANPTVRRSELIPLFPFLKQQTPTACSCQRANFEALDVLEHLWHTHVCPDPETRKRRTELPDWTEQGLSAWIESLPGDRKRHAKQTHAGKVACQQRAERIRAARDAALAALDQPSEADKIIVHGLGVRLW